MTTSNGATASKSQTTTIIVTALMLFSMFFGAGNLIFPPKLGVDAGTHFVPAIIGFLSTGVALPVLAIIAIAISGRNLRDLASRGGKVFAIAFPVLAYLSIGAFYALPRTGAVSFETAILPMTNWNTLTATALFNICFFGVALALSWNPNEIVTKLGKILTPALLILLVALVVLALANFDSAPSAPTEKFADAPLSAGLIEGYLTMDSIAGLAFGIIVISALRFKKVPDGKPMIVGTIMAGIIAGVLLGVIYLGLGYIGQIMPGADEFDNGANLLSAAANSVMGTPGQLIFGLIVLLACMTTAVGLIASTSEFFNLLLPGISYKAWAIIFTVMSTIMATQGLDSVLAIAAPVIGFIYPPAITLTFLTILEPIIARNFQFRWTYLLAIWVSVIWSAAMTFDSLGWGSSFLSPVLSLSPGNDVSLGWFIPVVIAFVIGYAIDAVTRNRVSPIDAQPVPVQS